MSVSQFWVTLSNTNIGDLLSGAFAVSVDFGGRCLPQDTSAEVEVVELRTLEDECAVDLFPKESIHGWTFSSVPKPESHNTTEAPLNFEQSFEQIHIQLPSAVKDANKFVRIRYS